VAQLERGELGIRLIERSTRSIRVTEIGRDVFAQCEVISGGLEATEAIDGREATFELRASGGMLNRRHWLRRSFRPLDLPMPEIDVGSLCAASIARAASQPRRPARPDAGIPDNRVRVSIGRSPRAARFIEPTAGKPPPARPTPAPPLR
jgi:DNA-binding transcriptional LysR family regulator